MVNPAVALGAQYLDGFASARVERVGDPDLKRRTPGSMALARAAPARAMSLCPPLARVLASSALGLAACQKGFTVAFTTAASPVTQLMEARDERRLLKLQRDLQAVKLLIVDELGYVPFSATGAELLFEAFSQRYEQGSTIITSNLPFEDWTSVLGSERLTGAPCSTGSPTTSAS